MGKTYTSPPKDFDLAKELDRWGIANYTHEQIEFKFGLLETMMRLTGSSDSDDWTPDTVTMQKFLDEFEYDGLRELMADTINDRANFFNRLVAMRDWNIAIEKDKANGQIAE